MSDIFRAAGSAFKVMTAVVTLLGLMAFLGVLVIGYVATGGTSAGGFFRWLLDGLAFLSG